ncbi:MAG: peptidoglycan DD-metalloendopeptidase family protein [Candidatus Limnocylindrales bacterium]
MIRRRADRSDAPAASRVASGWSTTPTTRRRSGLRRHLPALLLLIPLAFGLLGTPAGTRVAYGDELSDAKARQTQLKKKIADQKAQVAALTSLQAGLSDEISATRDELKEINVDLSAVRARIIRMEDRIEAVKAAYRDLVGQLEVMNLELERLEAEEALKRRDLGERRGLLADRVRNAYETDRTSPLETFVSGSTFTDLLAEMSYYIDVGEQDQALADQISRDKETLSALHETVAQTRQSTNDLRLETAAQKRALDASLKALEETRAELKVLEKKTAKALAQQKARYAAIARSKAAAARIIRKAAADQKALARRIDKLIERQVNRGNIPSKYNGTLAWPMNGTVSGNFGCSPFDFYPAGNGCEHFHNGVDLVAPYGTKVRASAAGTVVYVGWNWADGGDPAWIVVVAHSRGLRTWYAHLQPRRPVNVGDSVRKGQVLGYEGNTGKSTGSHLHWMVEANGTFVNPRLYT